MTKIKNKNYREFLETGLINLINEDTIKKVLSRVEEGVYKRQARALIIALYYSGARPNEVLRMCAGDVQKKNSYVTLKVRGSKRGFSRIIYLSYNKNELVKEFIAYAMSIPHDMLLFWKFRNHYVREKKMRGGDIKEVVTISDKLRYYFGKWFSGVIDEGIPPYYLRHNRFSSLSMGGATMEQIRQIKGSRTLDSVMPYLHMSEDVAKKTAKINK